MNPAIPRQVVVEMARRRRRFHYYLWHRVRNSWLRLTESERQAIHGIEPAWVPPRPGLDAMRRPLRDNESGEDFLFMHRRMITLANDILTSVGDSDYPRIEGWRRVPPPRDTDYPVPEFPESELGEVKSAEYFEQVIEPWERQYTDENYLRGVTLGQLGSDLQFTIHGAMHVRWTAPSQAGYRPSTVVEPEIARRWDTPTYEYLGDTYSSLVNPLFWKINGWMDDRVEHWRLVHGLSVDIEWKGTWVGPTVPRDAVEEVAGANDVLGNLYRIDRIISASAARGFDGFFRPHTREARPTPPVSWKNLR